MGTFFTFFFVSLVIGLLLGIMKVVANGKHNKESKIAFDKLVDFKADNYYLSTTSGISIGFDNTRKKICFLDKLHKPLIYDYTKILQCEVMIDGQTILKQSTSSIAGRAVLGGLLLGGVGAIVGGVTGKRTQNENVNNIDLKIVINDTANPVFRINFLNIKVKKGTPLYNRAYQKVETWHGLIAGLIRQGQDETAAHPPVATSSSPVAVAPGPPLSVADEIRKLKQLMTEGILTEEEFNTQKTKLIG